MIRRTGGRFSACLVLAVSLAADAVAADRKVIQLRHEAIVTAPRDAVRARLQAAAPVSGLWLLQFEFTPTAETRAALRDAGVKLLRYVPDDAFIVRCERADLARVEAVPGVRWAGEYRPDFKVAAALRQLAAAGLNAEVSLILAPDTPPEERFALRRALLRAGRETPLRSGPILRGRVTPAQLALLAKSPAVLWLEPAPQMKLVDEIAAKLIGGGDYETGEATGGFPGGGEDDDDGLFGARPRPQPHGLPSVTHQTLTQQLGYDGRGVTVAVADSGLMDGTADTMHPDLAGRADTFFFYGSLESAADEHGHGTHVSGIVAGDGATGEADEFDNLHGLGVAPGARIVTQRMFDGLGGYEPPPTFETLTRDAGRAGAEIGSNSWGDDTQGRYDVSAAEFDALVRDADALTPGEQPYILEFSAGNAGPGAQTIGSPAVAKNVIATGASQNDRYGYFIYEDGPDAMADFSSRGPCEDGRIKPDVVAPGTWIASLQSSSATDENAWLPISANYQFQGGTSQAGPGVSGAAAVFVQFYRATHTNATPSPALVKAALINSAVDLDDEAGGTEPVPNHEEGWGRVALTNLIGTPRGIEFHDQAAALTNGQAWERRFLSGDPQAPLKVTLVYTDVPGLPAAVPALVNDLDLEVVAPDGTVYRGNAFDAGDSIPNALAADNVNNVEGVHLREPVPGEWTVRVRATKVVEDIHGRDGVAPVQDFALVISGDLPAPGQGILVLDRPAYTAPAVIQLRLLDFDLAGQPGVTVQLSSDTEAAGEPVLLVPLGGSGLFTGAVATVTGPAAADGRLQITHGDTITAGYEDASPALKRTATAEADLVPPVISGVGAATRFGRVQVTWETDEEATSVVEHGPTAALGLAVTNRGRTDLHAVTIEGLAAGTRHFYRVISADAAGNRTVADNGGRPFEVVPEAAPAVLLVNLVTSSGVFDLGSLAAHQDALAEAGVPFETWDIELEDAAPTLADLRPYPVVVLRPDELAIPPAGFVRALSDYVNQGGSLLVGSFEFLSRLDEGGFENFRKNILQVDSYEADVGVDGVFGADHVSITSGVSITLDYEPYEILLLLGVVPADVFRTTPNAAPILFDDAQLKPAGLRAPVGDGTGGRVVFLSFPLDTLPADGEAPNTRGDLVRQLLGFLSPGLTDEATLALDREEYTMPGRVGIEVTDRDQAGEAAVTVAVRTETATVPRLVALAAQGGDGRFTGSILLVPDGAPPATNTIIAADGDTVAVRYADAPPGRTLTVNAYVDISPPAVLNVQAAPDYTEAVVRWQTDEPADATVQFGESTFLNRTAYTPGPSDVHELLLTGLQPDRDYVLQVVSRDPAGNATTDDNGGKLYAFRTLKPLTLPFVDDLEGGATNWAIADETVDDEAASILLSSTWELGRPDNELSNTAHSGLQAWGTNLRGEANDFANSSLVTPAIDLSGGNRATLRFWHNHDFLPRDDELDIIEYGGVYVTTNNGALWLPLRDYPDLTAGWEEEELDLTPYLGQTVRVGWAYALFSLGSVPHPGWLLDDVAITVTNITPGRIVIANNLSQASVALRGPLSRLDRGDLITVSNAPPGTYVVEWAPVPFYTAPPAVTNDLAGGQTLRLEGRYTFADANSNGLPDAWEVQYFGAAPPGRPAGADTDGDGMSELAEFQAGTNPTNAASRLVLRTPVPTAGQLFLAWEAAPGRSYRVQGSADAAGWTALTDWLRTSGTASSASVARPTNGAPYL
ncbi:MAG: S8 family serine peptidase, partial [Limisphaerales bacterium]